MNSGRHNVLLPIVYLLLLGTFLINGRSLFFRDPGTFFHTAVGEKMLREKQLITKEVLVYPYAGKPWIASQWLAETLMALLHRAGGFDALLLTAASLLALIYTFLFFLCLRQGLHPLLGFLVVILVLASSTHHFLIRPHLLTIFFLGLTFHLFCEIEAKAIPPRALLFLPPGFILWQSLHGGVIGGIASTIIVVGLWLVGPFLKFTSPLETKKDQAVAFLALFLILPVPLVNPYFLELPKTWATILSAPSVASHIKEHAPALLFWYGWMSLGLGVAYIIAIFSTKPGERRLSWILPLIWLYLGLGRVRNTPLFAILAGIGFANMIPFLRLPDRLRLPDSQTWIRPPDRTLSCFSVILLSTAIWAGGILLQRAQIQFPLLGKGWVRLESDWWPISQISNLKEFAKTKPEGTTLFNEMLFGGFLVYSVPELQTFIDDRCELAGDDGIRAYLEAENDPERLHALEEKWRFRGALTIPGSGFDRYFRGAPGWRLIEACPSANLYRRN